MVELQRLLYFGMLESFSVPPLETLLRADVEVAAVIVPPTQRDNPPVLRQRDSQLPEDDGLRIIEPHHDYNIIAIAWANNIPVWEVSTLSDPQVIDLIASYQPDLMAVACFCHIFPPELLRLPTYGIVNLHPSPLPAYRGPAPLFWMAREGEAEAAITLHFMDEALDTGDIIAQRRFNWPIGLSEAQIERRCAVIGGELLVEAVQHVAKYGLLPRQPQPPDGASYFYWPSQRDLIVPTAWSAERAFRFLRGASSWPLAIELKGGYLSVRGVAGYEPEGCLGKAWRQDNGEVLIQFNPGVLRVMV